MKAFIPIVYWPIKVLFVDDDPEILKLYSIKYQANYNMSLISNSLEAFRVLKEQKEIELGIVEHALDQTEIKLTDNENEFLVKKLNLTNILEIVKNKSKYNQIGIVVADYEMPGMTGIDMFKKLESKFFKKMILTSKYSLSSAVESFNNKTIDNYIAKGTENTFSELTFFLQSNQLEYFKELTNNTLGDSEFSQLPFLKNNNFIIFFNKMITKHKIREYYLIDKNGSFILIDDTDQHFIFIRHTNESLTEFSKSCEFYGLKNKNSKLFNLIQHKALIPFFGINTDPSTINFSEWDRYFYEANKDLDFYWTIIKLENNL